MLDMRQLKDLEIDQAFQNKECQWKLVETKGEEHPGPLAHHSSVVHDDKMYLFGGSNLETENRKFYSLDLNTMKWEVIKSRGELPLTRDEHSAVVNEEDGSMLVFGGFSDGRRTNELVRYSFSENKWESVKTSGE
mmetsp:Transcript_29024/g.21597  ORF Transcript_29024/g.21597 Transcript_29024/m.21597 type:complete len:135 (+) Transcript_29024:275-679(+)